MWPLGSHKQICQRKQDERADRIANLPKSYQGSISSDERSILDDPIDQLVQDVQNSIKSPADILRAYGKAAVKAHEATNCLTEIMFPEAEKWTQDGSINLKGPLAGIPVSLKDSIVVGGYDASVGYSGKCFKPHAADGAMVRLLKDAGAIPFVKTALPITLLSFESTNDVWGRCKNPHNARYSPGGSTGGEGALLAFGGSRIGIGSDVAGSVRAPAHFSGCFSLRCSTGRWPKYGVDTSMPGQEGIPSVFSPMTRTLSDLVYFTRSLIQCKPWTYDQSVHPLAWREDDYEEFKDKKRLRIGVLRTDGVVDPAPACARALETTASALKVQGHDVFDLTLPSAPHAPLDALAIASQLLNAEGTRTYKRFFNSGEWNDAGASQLTFWMKLPSPLRWLYVKYVRYIRRDAVWARLLESLHEKSAYENWQLVYQRESFKNIWFDWWNGINTDGKGEMDVMITPPNATPAVPHDGMKDAVSSCGYTFLFNLLDYTCGIIPVTKVDAAKDALPSGFVINNNGVAQGAYKHYDAQAMAGLPVAVQVVGRRLEEEKILAIMERVEQALKDSGSVYELLQVP
ncbi:amidase signature enzyme [Aureobasidium pullulans]|uniref:amidase n=1 Tax=Aureobasidium pullulans TaxID=5580 RepID=A0A4S9C292_AURPU|nr:amidase signature enzyme [Aureobasidium pullulans]